MDFFDWFAIAATVVNFVATCWVLASFAREAE
jgi:hypothetical protein